MKRILFILLLIPSFSQAMIFDGLPSEIKQALKDAYSTNNTYVIEAVTKYTKEKYPNFGDKIESYATSIEQENKAKEEKAEKSKDQKKRFSGNIDTSMNIANGNTKKQDLSSSSRLSYEGDKFSNTLNVTGRGSREDQTRTNEEYTVNNQTRYKLSNKLYSFMELEYVNDRYSGYQYRSSELMGLGYKFYDTDVFKILGEAGTGARQSKLTDMNKEKSVLGKVGAKAEWQINDKFTFTQDISSSFDSDAVITVWDTNIKTNIVDSIYLKLNYNLQYIDDVPVGKKHIDTFTALGIGYEF